MTEIHYTIKEAMIFSQRIAQLSKAMWKIVEGDLQRWIKPFDLNINEHHILMIAQQKNGASISDVAKLGVMHVSTAFNFSKKLEERGLLEFSKKENDKRNTYIELTEKGRELLLKLMESYEPEKDVLYNSALPLKNLYGQLPTFIEMQTIVRNIYGDEFIENYETIETDIENILNAKFEEEKDKSDKPYSLV